jgi:PAS domain-containing protein
VTRNSPASGGQLDTSEEPDVRRVRQRLAEAEATIQALLSGQIDAVVDATTGTPALLAKAQDARRESEERHREQAALLDIAHDAIYVRDLDGHITYWNKGTEQAYGWGDGQADPRRPRHHDGGALDPGPGPPDSQFETDRQSSSPYRRHLPSFFLYLLTCVLHFVAVADVISRK